MVDPNHVTNFKRTDDELLEFWLFCLFVRGKNASVQARKLEAFLNLMGGTHRLRLMGAPHEKVMRALILVGAGQYRTLATAIHSTITILWLKPKFLRECSVEALEAIHGVGPKTARFFLMHTRKGVRHAALDTHILRYMREVLDVATPTSSPSGERYAELEKIFLTQADYEGVDPATLDLAIWRASRDSHPANWRKFMEA